MGLFVVALLAGLWVSVLLPGVYRARRDLSGIDSTRSFQRTMSMLARNAGATRQTGSGLPGRCVLVLDDRASGARSAARSRMRQRQRAGMAQLGSAACVSGGLAVFLGGMLWTVFGLTAAVFACYALLVVQVRVREAERREKVRDLRPARRSTAAAHGNMRSNVRIHRWVG
ncbi:MAG: hypothetical protein ACRDZ4_17970 [Egibacteraceae bacterium]